MGFFAQFEERGSTRHKPSTFAIEGSELLNDGWARSMKLEFVLKAIGVLRGKIGVESVAFAMVFGPDALEHRGLSDRNRPTVPMQMSNETIIVDPRVLQTNDRLRYIDLTSEKRAHKFGKTLRVVAYGKTVARIRDRVENADGQLGFRDVNPDEPTVDHRSLGL